MRWWNRIEIEIMPEEKKLLDFAEVAKHNTADDAWMHGW
jgi:hypothetical protein